MLEFELKIKKRKEGSIIQYGVLRKGECIGILVLGEPYDKITKKSIRME